MTAAHRNGAVDRREARRRRLGIGRASMAWAAVAALCAACSFSGSDSERTLEVPQAVNVMADEFAALPLEADDRGQTTVGVLSFASPEGATVLGERMAHELSVALARRYGGGEVRVITRYHLDDLLQEQGMSLLDSFEPSDVPQVGRLLGADYLIMGLLSPEPDAVHMSAQMLSVADGVIVGGLRSEVEWEPGRTKRLTPVVTPSRSRAYSNRPVAKKKEPARTRDLKDPWWEPLARRTPTQSASLGSANTTPPSSAPDPRRSPLPASPDRPPAASMSILEEDGAAAAPVEVLPGELLDVRASHQSVYLDPDRQVASTTTVLARVGVDSRSDDDLSLLLDEERRPTHICIVMDTSGSMREHGRLTYAKRATREVLAVLQPTDTVSVVTFNTRAGAVVEPTYATKEAKENISLALESLVPDGNTDFDAALTEVNMCFRMTADRGTVNYTLFISDGAPTQGARSPNQLGRLAQQVARLGVSIDTVGVGEEVRIETLEAIARAANGRFHAVQDDGSLVDLVTGRVLSATGYLGEEGRLGFRPATNIDVVYAGEGWIKRPDGTLLAELGLLHAGDDEMWLIELRPRPGVTPEAGLVMGEMTLDYLDRRRRPHHESSRLRLAVTGDPEEHRRGIDPVVVYAANREKLGQSLRKAYDLAGEGRTSEAADVIDRAVSSLDAMLAGTSGAGSALEPLADLVERARDYRVQLARGRYNGELRDALYKDATGNR